MSPKALAATIERMQLQIGMYQAALQRIAHLPKDVSKPEEEEYDDTESAYSNGVDVGEYQAFEFVAKIAKEALR